MAVFFQPNRCSLWNDEPAFIDLGIVVGLAGVLTVVPMLKDLAMIFGISQILWFAWIGIVMLRRIHS